MDSNHLHPSYHAAVPTGPYSARAPSPPYIHVPPPTDLPNRPLTPDVQADPSNSGSRGRDEPLMTIHPSPFAPHITGLSPADVLAITDDGAPQSARDTSSQWVYEGRRRAQSVLSYLYLGPSSAVRDREFLVREGITMVLCARDARFAAAAAAAAHGGMLVMGVTRAVEGLGIAVDGIDVADGRELVAAFAVAAGKVNAHLLAVSRARQLHQQQQQQQNGTTEPASHRRGRVLVVCETGNDRSAAVVAAYLMTMYGLDTVQAVQFMQLKRFCVALGDEFKFQLQAYGDILQAKGDVGQTHGQHPGQQAQQAQKAQQAQQQQLWQQMPQGGGGGKRRLEQTMDEEVDGGQNPMEVEMDAERYAGRGFAPFVDRD
ncbi:protein-tyrosine phosphatase-like protein [Dichotomopilus funicola]|uniref:Protein-tyrosine phosphatase-like protein n=1 Tax=Dichotomopilus funicola TaxID=1934379 RepID=A0AAN6V1V8_9PEZI|nr:protein-tyrosine phosphatase-like protein [Dichotomopilus funicola]